MNVFERKAIFSHNVPGVHGGKPEKFIEALRSGGFEAVYLKAADGTGVFRPNRVSFPLWGENVKAELVAALKRAGIAVIGWGFNYGNDPIGEANIAVSQAHRLQLDGWIFDVESVFERHADHSRRALIIASRFKEALPKLPTAFCSWALWWSPTSGVQWHPPAKAKPFMDYCDFGMPMMYWYTLDLDKNKAQLPAYEARAKWLHATSTQQWKRITDKPIIPVGRAYIGDGGVVTQGAMTAFEQSVRAAGQPGISWWVLDAAHKRPEWWQELSVMPGFVTSVGGDLSPQPSLPGGEEVSMEERVDRLWKAHPEIW